MPREIRKKRLADQRRRAAEHVRLVTGNMVAAGPFRGLHLGSESSWGNTCPVALLLGCYELELQSQIEQVISANPKRVVDVGCAEGYYAVGFARRLPGAEVHSFDIDPAARALCASVADLNTVGDRIVIRVECTHAELQSLAGADSFFFAGLRRCRAGAAGSIAVPGLAVTPVLVELHDFVDPTITSTLLARFGPTHDVQIVTSAPRDKDAVLLLKGLPAALRSHAVDEWRPTRPPDAVGDVYAIR